MLSFAITALDIGYWGDKLLYVFLVAGCLVAGCSTMGKKRRKETQRRDDLDIENTADISRSGPPRFNG